MVRPQSVALAVALLVASCGEETSAPATTKEAKETVVDVIGQFQALKVEMCKCADKACALKVNDKFDEWTDANANTTGSAEQRDQAKKISEEYTGCMVKAMAAK